MKQLFKEFFFLFFRKYIKTVFFVVLSLIGLMKWKDFFSRWELVRINSRLKLGQTLYINLRTLPFHQAIKVPILIYGKTTFLSLKGEILISDSIHYGMLKIGISDAIRSYESVNLIDIDGLLNVFSGNVLRQGIKLRISNNGKVVLNRNVYIGDNNTLISDEAILFGANTRVGNNSTFIDTDFHYMINTKTREVKNNKSAIIIGENNWIGGWCTIKKGAITPTATILAGPYSMISKDYTKIIGENSIIGGTPAKLLVDGYRRVSSLMSESNIANHYGSTKEIYTLEQNIGIDYFCIPKSIED